MEAPVFDEKGEKVEATVSEEKPVEKTEKKKKTSDSKNESNE